MTQPIITKIDIYRFSIPMEPFAIATGTLANAQNVFIRVHTSAGFYGVGECSAFPMIVGETQDTCLVMAREFARLWVGKDALDIVGRLQQLHDFTAGNTTIKSAFDIALYDISAKYAELPLYQFLGGEKRVVESDITIGIASPDIMAGKASAFKKSGANILKVKLGKNAVEDIERIKMIRETIGSELNIRIDANQGWSFDDAVFALQALDKYDIEFCEQPMRTWYDDRLPELMNLSPVKIMADESVYNHHDARKQINSGSCHYINIKMAKSGGIFEAKKIHDTAAEKGIACMMGGMLESRIALSAKLHFVYASPNIKFYDMDTCKLGHLEDPCIGGAVYDGYKLDINDAAGIGADADEEFLSKCEHITI
ncbi:L-alanine-DL-glutamate epimerase-like enolase superfamily enzyme [Mucilaginibacter frigoritolerans]|jgi:L-Ala-D/L-Glu epimerase|uniref:Dipeptide epimerase n=1 Tax=Mucilaginibacter frigoritolerans TaxID=652788 RepID=A0A562UGB2_9SPHI|nr:dipeptide epimerase [Mucilaginibacter frigoritolerans]TWJ04803.1 L-alanine-DL-glutamate epimerase-like enolase superfamily enzyme [Mucilaginibacter frigoritolerans]